MKNYMAAVLLLCCISCKKTDKNYRSISQINVPDDAAVEPEEESSVATLPATPEEVGQAVNPELVEIASAVKSKLTMDLNNTLAVLKNNNELKNLNLNLDLDINEIVAQVEKAILNQESLEQLQNNKEQISTDIQDIIKNEVKAKMGVNSSLVDAIFDEVSKQISSQLIKSFE